MNRKPWDKRMKPWEREFWLEHVNFLRACLTPRPKPIALGKGPERISGCRAARKAERQCRHYARMHNRKGSHV